MSLRRRARIATRSVAGGSSVRRELLVSHLTERCWNIRLPPVRKTPYWPWASYLRMSQPD